jgi:hypothetical protein
MHLYRLANYPVLSCIGYFVPYIGYFVLTYIATLIPTPLSPRITFLLFVLHDFGFLLLVMIIQQHGMKSITSKSISQKVRNLFEGQRKTHSII